MKKINITKIQDIIENRNINIIGLILHGSRTLNIQNKESDLDILGVVESGTPDDIIEIIDGEKYHIVFKSKKYLENLSEEFSDTILNRIFDFNTLSGRILSGRIIWEQNKDEIKSIIAQNIYDLDIGVLDTKLNFQMLGQLKDATTDNRYINLICIQNAVDTLICRFLLKKNIFFLNQKWFPYYIEKYFEKELLQYYFKLRFSQNPNLVEFKKILEWINSYEV
ncbi:hypothetical protein [Streptococcus mitis]|jgi:hypothetical protein|uniref:hypothetical protein n=1 Tax=Streptococcus mitis TaxID=28037 RepID=UPI001C4F7650|nr:hypothetical protein [Streptococcus mitis]MDU4467188.1 hypothetical protein [Streptococcus mitis]